MVEFGVSYSQQDENVVGTLPGWLITQIQTILCFPFISSGHFRIWITTKPVPYGRVGRRTSASSGWLRIAWSVVAGQPHSSSTRTAMYTFLSLLKTLHYWQNYPAMEASRFVGSEFRSCPMDPDSTCHDVALTNWKAFALIDCGLWKHAPFKLQVPW